MTENIIEPKCRTRRCRHFQGARDFTPEVEQDQRLICPAFPDGIPLEISHGDNPHDRIYPGQFGKIVFEP